MLRRIGIFGGAFDPPHVAHVALVRCAIEVLKLDEVRVLPTGQAWHRHGLLTEAVHRVAMCRLAFADLALAHVDDRETRRHGPSYTIETLLEIGHGNPDAQLYLLLGDDQRRSLHAWHRIEDIARLAIICVAERDPQVRSWSAEPSAPAQIPGLRIQHLPLPPMPISATHIRSRLAQQSSVTDPSVAHLLAPAVARYIQDHHLYGPRAMKAL